MQFKFRILLLITLKSMRTSNFWEPAPDCCCNSGLSLCHCLNSQMSQLSQNTISAHLLSPSMSFYYLHITLTSLVLPFQFYILIWSIIHHINADSTHLVSNFVLCHDDKHYVSVETAGNMLNWRQNFFNPNSGIMVIPIVTKNWHPYYCTVSMLPLKG